MNFRYCVTATTAEAFTYASNGIELDLLIKDLIRRGATLRDVVIRVEVIGASGT